MDRNFHKRLQQTLYSGELDSAHSPLTLTELTVEFFQDLTPTETVQVDLETASRISNQETVSPASMVMSMIYARRLLHKRPDQPRKLNSSDLFLISMMMASKYLYDEGADEEVFNDEWAENAGMDTKDINNMELDFLDALEWELFIRKEDFEQAMLSIEKRIALREGLKRGWFSYTDLCLLLEEPWMDLSLSDVGLEWLKVIIISAVVYCVGVVSCVVMANACLTLASSGLTPALLPEMHVTPAIPQDLSSAPSLPYSPALGFPREISQPSPTAFRNNAAEERPDEDKVSKPVLKNEEQTLTAGETIVDTLISQLMTVLAFKSHLVQFVRAVSDGYSANTCTNLSSAKGIDSSGCDMFGGSTGEASGRAENDDAGAVSLVRLDVAPSSSESKCCLHCGLRWSAEDAELNTGFALSDLQQCYEKWCKEFGLQPLGLERDEWRKSQGVETNRTQHQGYRDTVKLHANNLCIKRETASLHHLFPDVVVGFSTSMPAAMYDT